MAERAAIILAAGQGTRMKSSLPKVLHKVGGRAMLDWSIDLARRVGCEQIVTVISPNAPELHSHVAGALGEDAIAVQERPLGTGHAVQSAERALAGFRGDVIVLYGDTPLIPSSAVESLFEALEAGAGVGVLGFRAEEPGAYGRLVTSYDGDLEAIVEAKDASPEQLKIDLCNSGVMAVRAERLFRLLSQVTNENQKGEYYLTDIAALARDEGAACKVVTCHERDVLGVNSRRELATAEAAFQERRRGELLDAGVTLTAPETVYFSYDTIVEPDCTIEPNVIFAPGVHVRRGSMIRAFSHLEGANVEEGAEIGPYARLRPGAIIGEGAKIGNFVEVKKTRVGAGAKANHLAYLGDGDIGANANIGAGTIFCNYDGFLKYQTKIGANAFIGSNSALVAPVKIGNGAIVGSGSVITENVSDNALAVARGRQVEKAEWASEFRQKKAAEKKARS
ncbi:bifunctional UDP-N-acetylglucosamine diphosphorylase/glucosamine-1-phosphate N-acetyltransferase GlmU [Henriciella aquimarina]|uniref:bifunctional UDP-N-acetylglucosamine diphosphorylase/glucosamine-1-phosphate N-acetyltransferase GlmU n=1 Tax=Henriciella aquimarina TaxID=545261 RepID=UPI0009FC9F35|nr:bifunctional UDP-N-acetylglucosamine diphosphorylase/glucosamine-1-phosphate N-acetyltransferase GlmU [Henriciella aquimarina]